jgi:hypothetical protein
MSAYSDQIEGLNPVSYWRCGEPSGTTLVDAVGSNDGTTTNGTAAQPGAISGDADTSFVFASGYADCGAAADLLLDRDFTLEAWIYPTTVSGAQGIISHGAGSWCLRLNDDDVQFLESNVAVVGTSSATVNVDEWSHVVLTVAANGDWTIYINGAAAGTGNTARTFDDGSESCLIGGDDTGIPGSLFTGRIDEVAVYDAALSAGQVLSNYNLGAGISGPSVSTRTVLTEGNTLRLVCSESVTIGAGGNGGVTVTPSGGAATATYASGSGSTTLLYTLSRTLATSETLTCSYTQPGNGIEATTGGADLATFADAAVTNNTINAPTIGTATATGTDAIDLTWTDNASNETQFEAQYDTADTFDVDPQTILVDTADAESTEAATLAADTTYYLRVRAKNGNGVSLWSDDVSATTDAEEAEAEEMPRSPAGWLRRRRLKF